MNKYKKIVSSALIVIMILGICGCTDPVDRERESLRPTELIHTLSRSMDEINAEIETCTGTGFYRRGMADRVAAFDEIVEYYSGKKDLYGNIIPEFMLRTPGKHTVTENTRYDIVTLPKNEIGYYTGIEIIVYEIDSQESETGISESSSEVLSVLPIDEIVGTYQMPSTIETRMKGKDEDEEWRVIDETEVTFTYVITAVDDKNILIQLGEVKFGEGLYDPVSCTCEFKVAPEFYEALNATSTDDKTMRLVFSKVDGKIQFEQTTVGGEDEPSIAYKV